MQVVYPRMICDAPSKRSLTRRDGGDRHACGPRIVRASLDARYAQRKAVDVPVVWEKSHRARPVKCEWAEQAAARSSTAMSKGPRLFPLSGLISPLVEGVHFLSLKDTLHPQRD